ncbi:MAG TPA: hypothetical protein VFH72_10600 [Candidatus Baltobacteraceae bacterium]|nr:hypothetical protein [Candidatus Baltobacteraceae bacterium]
MHPFDAALEHAIASAAAGDLPSVRRTLEDLRALSRQRREAITDARHDLGNVLSIAEASVEAMIDGVAPASEARLNRLRDLLLRASSAMYALTSDAD